MKRMILRFFVITVLFILIIPAQSYPSLANDGDCTFCMSDSNYLSAIDDKCAGYGPDFFTRGYQLLGQDCESGYCSYTFKVLCSKEVTYPSIPPDLLFIDEEDTVYTYTFCWDCLAGDL